MAEEPTTSFFAVHGELLVRVDRPPMRFGLALYVMKRSGDRVWQAIPNEKGELVAEEAVPNEYPDRPTLYLDEWVAAALKDALIDVPTYLPGQETATHLKDTIQTRDRMTTLVEKLVESLIQPRTERR